ncbi:MAG: YdeI/OmpD-associated family protein [Thermomicrobiales bacterium]
MKFRAVLELAGKTATGIQVPVEVVTALGAGKRPAVSVTINGYTYRSTVAPMGGVYMLPVSAEIRANAGIAAGDEVEVEVALDTAPREVVVPPDLAEALAGDAEAKQRFEALSYSNKRRHVLSVEGTKNEETRKRRVAKAIEDLKAGK